MFKRMVKSTIILLCFKIWLSILMFYTASNNSNGKVEQQVELVDLTIAALRYHPTR